MGIEELVTSDQHRHYPHNSWYWVRGLYLQSLGQLANPRITCETTHTVSLAFSWNPHCVCFLKITCLPLPSFLLLLGFRMILKWLWATNKDSQLSLMQCLSCSFLTTSHSWGSPGHPDICFKLLRPVSGEKLGIGTCKGVLLIEVSIPLWLSYTVLSVSEHVISW